MDDERVTVIVRTVHNWYGHEAPRPEAEMFAWEFLYTDKKRLNIAGVTYNTDHILSVEVLAKWGIV